MFGYAKIFQQIFDSSIADDWQVRHVFEDLLKLANSDGVVDMTHDAIARRTNTPLEIIIRAIAELEKPDPRSRSTIEEGARIKRMDDHRDWGWWIVNHTHYRDLSTDEQYRAKSRERMRKFRENAKKADIVTQRDATVTHVTPSRSKKQIADADIKAGEKTKVSGAVAPDLAIAIYEAYPRKVGRPAALNAIYRQLKQFAAETILEKTTLYAKYRLGQDPQFTPHPATWFNQQRFNDDPATWTATGNHRGHTRNACVIKGPTDYAAVFKRKREESEKAALARQLAQAQNNPPAANGT